MSGEERPILRQCKRGENDDEEEGDEEAGRQDPREIYKNEHVQMKGLMGGLPCKGFLWRVLSGWAPPGQWLHGQGHLLVAGLRLLAHGSIAMNSACKDICSCLSCEGGLSVLSSPYYPRRLGVEITAVQIPRLHLWMFSGTQRQRTHKVMGHKSASKEDDQKYLRAPQTTHVDFRAKVLQKVINVGKFSVM